MPMLSNKKSLPGLAGVREGENLLPNYTTKARDIPLLDIVRQFSGVELRQRGRELWGLCPFHAEKTPSFSVNPAKSVWHCYGCGAGGSGVDFVMKLRGLSFKDAAAVIEQAFGIGGSSEPDAKSPAQIRYERERALEQKINRTFDFVWTARRAIQSELKRQGKKVPSSLILDLGELETIEEELTGGADRIAVGLRLAKRWMK